MPVAIQETGMKFDVVVGNPPYQDPRTKGQKLWFEFVKRVTEMNPTFIAFVTPNSWFYEPNGRKTAQVIQAVQAGSITFADVQNVNQYFPNIGEDIGYWIWQSTPGRPGVVVANWFGTIEGRPFIVGTKPITSTADSIRASLEHKFANKMSVSVRVVGLRGMRWTPGAGDAGLQGSLSPSKTLHTPYAVRLSPANTMYHKNKVGKFGVCVSRSGYFYKKGYDEKYMPITDDDTGQHFLKIECNSQDEAENVKSFLTSKLYVCYVMLLVGKAFNDYALARLPFLGRDKMWTDQELYEFFGLTEAEVQFLESFEIP